ncbi:histone deacetylase complex subunit SAP130 [Salvelinus sp. IW2-2015]|uniref:histone deacetylase complex subunit SAP130 n=1 Tax=Salvelinus sp. IW2-2015 TaxID=2691554 RepID=UPI000CEB11A6|nr:histone deacetylase complex subunit SAP130-like [Salvelinus alpinus]
MSSQSFSTAGMPAQSNPGGMPAQSNPGGKPAQSNPGGKPAQSNPGGKPVSINQSSNQTAGPGEDSSGDMDHHGPQDIPASSRGGQEALSFREDKQETGVVRPYPQVPVQTYSLQSQVPALSQQVPNRAGTPGQPVTVSNLPVQLLQAQPAALVDGQMKAALKSLVPSRLIAPASSQVQGGHVPVPLPPKVQPALLGHVPLPLPPKVQPALLGHITVTLESHMAPTSSIPVATISGQQGHSSNRHHLMPANIQIIRAPSVPQHTFTSHLPRGAVAAAVMSSCKGPAVLRPASGASVGPVQHTVHHITHQSIQSRSPVTSSTAVAPISATRNQSPVTSSTAVAPISATRNQSPVTSSTATGNLSSTIQTSAMMMSCVTCSRHPGLTIHPPPATISIQRPQGARDTATRITLPSHPAIGGQKPQPPHTMTQKSIFCSGTPVAAATVVPILTNTGPGTTTTGTASHTQVTSGTIVTMTMPSHSSHASALSTSTIPVAKVVPQPIAHTSPRVQSDYLGERTNLIQPIAHTSPHVQSDYQPIAHTSPRVQSDYPVERTNLISISGNRSSPNPVTIEARSDNRPVHFQYFLPTFSSSPYPRTHTYTPITSSVSTIRQYPVTPQTPSSTLPSQPAVAVPTTLHLNPMQLMAVDRIGLQSAQISTQGIQPQPMGAQGIQPAPMGVQGLHSSGPIGTQGIQQAPIAGQQPEAKPSGMVLADGSTFVAGPFGATQPVATMVQTHPQGGVGGGALTLVSSPRPSILRKKPANEGCGVGKTLIPAVPGEAHSGRVEGGVRGAGQPRAAGVKPKAEVHMTMVAPPVLVMAAVEALPSQGGAEQQAVSSPAQQHLSQAIPSNLLAPRGPPPPSQPSSTAHLSALPAAMAVTPTGPASMAKTVASPTQPAASSTAACSGGSAHTEVKIKQETESMEMYQPVPQPSANSGLSTQPHQTRSLHGAPSSGDLVPGASPRKKPRKQQHVISTEETEMLETNSTDEDRAMGHRPLGSRAKRRESPPREYVDEEGVRYVPVRPRPPVTLLRHYRNPWKAAYHHFQRYSDIRIKEEESLQDVANQRGVARRAQGWRMHLCVAQLMQLSNLEHDVYSRLTSLQEGLIPKKRAGVDNELHRINELIQGNMQRCKLVMDQVTEARDTMMKVLDHKDKVLKLLNQNGAVKKSNKLKRKDRA